ncbi:MAG: RNA 2',3'-cyclic phosphodiesterase [Firmicutes bacterium]|nr:RNA 2',3'-cyclic phosphodiesterase [Bacillota bacterium]
MKPVGNGSVGNSSPLRLFLACPISPAVAEQCVQYQESLRRRGWRGAYPAREALHLTLYFLGDVEPTRVDEIVAIARSVMASEPFTVHWDTVGRFGPREHPRVIWVGQSRPPGALLAFQRRLQSSMMEAGLGLDTARERWTPHITLLRVHEASPMPSLPPWPSTTDQFTQVLLMHSTLTPTGARYRTLEAFSLQSPHG